MASNTGPTGPSRPPVFTSFGRATRVNISPTPDAAVATAPPPLFHFGLAMPGGRISQLSRRGHLQSPQPALLAAKPEAVSLLMFEMLPFFSRYLEENWEDWEFETLSRTNRPHLTLRIEALLKASIGDKWQTLVRVLSEGASLADLHDAGSWVSIAFFLEFRLVKEQQNRREKRRRSSG